MHYSTNTSRFYSLPLFLLLGLFILTNSCAPNRGKQLLITQANIIPAPQQIEKGGGNFTLTKTSTLFAIPEVKTVSNFLKTYLLDGAGIDVISAPQTAATIVIIKDTLLPKEGYRLTISKKRITIKASDGAGAFYAIQSLRHILPPDVEQENTSGVDTITIPCLEIKDAPMFAYRPSRIHISEPTRRTPIPYAVFCSKKKND